jgi:hypothetical protein
LEEPVSIESDRQLIADLITEVKDLLTHIESMVNQLERSFTTEPEDIQPIMYNALAVLDLLRITIERAHSIYLTPSSKVALADAASVMRGIKTKLKGIK